MALRVLSHTLKVTVDRTVLLKALQQTGSAISERGTLPILSHVLLQVTADGLICTATDLDIGMTVHVPADVHEEGGLAVPARRLVDIVKELPEGPVQLQARKNQSLLIESAQCSFRLVGLAAEEFPQLPPFPESHVVSVNQESLKRILTLTSFAMSHEESRYVLNGVLLDAQQDTLKLVATDGRRLAMATATLSTPSVQDLRVIVPSKTVRELSRLLTTGVLDITLLAGNQILFRLGTVTLISRLVEGEFPNHEKVIPAPCTTPVRAPRQALLSAVRRAALLATTASQAVRFDITAHQLTIFKEATDIGEVRQDVAVAYEGKALTVHFNPHYLLDMLKVLPEDEVVWEVTSADKPGVVRAEQYLYIVLPMQPT
jgi:DNA polymerase III subunit beta